MITTEIKRVKNHINGEWVESTGTEVEAVPNPATGKNYRLRSTISKRRC